VNDQLHAAAALIPPLSLSPGPVLDVVVKRKIPKPLSVVKF